jgi:hypothetical protein
MGFLRIKALSSARFVAEAVAQIDYPNFKTAVHGDRNRNIVHMRVWAGMHELQKDEQRLRDFRLLG